ncbi:uncharacterized protein RSE6_06387 [Rhynchosporium secalis]|uniref:Uncharacterized protein n=1 Tax=Rhynchosporium secalis TaxID=38038 RepID=A0A1E1MBB2_RHYSE|nr:uncharacterized protein RSE6_06387 [Rhynchosporium secalis]
MCPSLVNLRIRSLRTFPFHTSSSIVSSVFLLQFNPGTRNQDLYYTQERIVRRISQ